VQWSESGGLGRRRDLHRPVSPTAINEGTDRGARQSICRSDAACDETTRASRGARLIPNAPEDAAQIDAHDSTRLPQQREGDHPIDIGLPHSRYNKLRPHAVTQSPFTGGLDHVRTVVLDRHGVAGGKRRVCERRGNSSASAPGFDRFSSDASVPSAIKAYGPLLGVFQERMV